MMTTQLMRTVLCSVVFGSIFASDELSGSLQIPASEFGDKKAGLREPCDSGKKSAKCPGSAANITEEARLALLKTSAKCTGCFSVPMPECCRELRYHPGDAIRKSLDKAKFTRYMYELAMPAMNGTAYASSTIKTLHKLNFDNIVSFQAIAMGDEGLFGNSAPLDNKQMGYYVWIDETHFVVTRTSTASILDDATVRVYISVDTGRP